LISSRIFPSIHWTSWRRMVCFVFVGLGVVRRLAVVR
jgi:hypothetical protein